MCIRDRFHMLSLLGVRSQAWFISATSVLNALGASERITWQPEAFLRFASTLFPPAATDAAEEAFEALLFAVAQSGLNVLDERAVEKAFGMYVDEATIMLLEQKERLEEALSKKYGEPLED